MAGIFGSSDSTCNTHNALRNISGYACGVTFSFKSDGFSGFEDGFAVVSLQECCDKANAPVMRIPGNTGCEMQFCGVPEATTSYIQTIEYSYATGTGTAAQTPAPSVTHGVKIGPPGDVENCMAFVYEGDLPDDIGDGVSNAGNWCVVRMYDDDSSKKGTAVTAKSAPASWTSAAADPWASALASETSTATAKSTSASSAAGRDHDAGRICGVRTWAIITLLFGFPLAFA
ncbi:hypothetical protein BJ170DRAFT_91139 [Xylariales sp. AK1849]|nr:hypothetical protein BJ170DRAFT_91139 [Xylariales sp. AK1849]